MVRDIYPLHWIPSLILEGNYSLLVLLLGFPQKVLPVKALLQRTEEIREGLKRTSRQPPITAGGYCRAFPSKMSALGNYSCETAAQTLEWIHAIIDFLKPFSFFSDALVVNFFKDRLWEAVDKEWMDCLRNEPVEYLLQIPSGVVQVS